MDGWSLFQLAEPPPRSPVPDGMNSDIRIHALIRPRFGDFLYSEEEFQVILEEVRQFRQAGTEIVVIGCHPEGSLHMEYEKTHGCRH
ncbi:MAG: copper homeostasis protein CutC [Eisenbergiella sp.]